jgi:hypothetical protein
MTPSVISPRLRARVRSEPSTIIFQVTHCPADAAVAVLQDVFKTLVWDEAGESPCGPDDVIAEERPVIKFGHAWPTPSGACGLIDAPDSSPRESLAILEAVAAAVHTALPSAQLGVAPWNDWPSKAKSDSAAGPVVRLRVFGDSRAADPVEPGRERAMFVPALDAWVSSEASDATVAAFSVEASAEELPVRQLSLLHEVMQAGHRVLVVVGSLDATAWLGQISGFVDLELAFGAPGASRERLLAEARRLAVIAARLSSVSSYAFIEFVSAFGTYDDPEELGEAFGARIDAVGMLPDEAIYDAAWFQVLSAKHVAKLSPEARERCEPLGEGRYGLTLGEPEDWLAASSRRRPLEEWRDILRPLLLAEDQILDCLAERRSSRK